MSQDFTKDLSPYEDNNRDPIRGQYHFDIPQDIEPNAYAMNIDYESHDTTHPDAYQYDGWIVIGHRPYFLGDPLIVPYNTLAVSEEAITAYEKFSTTFNAIVKVFEDSAFQRSVKNLPYQLRVLKGQFKDYYADPDATARTNIVNDYNTSSQLIDVTMPQSSGNSGMGTTPLKVSNIYESNQTIQNYNTLFARCKGTRDRGTDNYVPGTLVIPLIIGTTGVYLRSISSLTTQMDADNDGVQDTVTTVCGSGTVKLDIDIFYQWAMRQDTQNNHMKYGYEDWRTDVNKQVRVGAVKLQTNINGTWEDVPKNLITPANNYTTILDDGSIIHKPNTVGELEINYTNPIDYGTTTSFKYRFQYIGKIGATFDNISGELPFKTSPDYGTDTKIPTKIYYKVEGENFLDSSHTIELYKGIDNNLVFKTYLKKGNTYVPASAGLEGTYNYTFYGEDGNVVTTGIGAGTIRLPKNKRGTTLEIQYVPNSSNLASTTTTFNIHYTPQETEITFSNQKTINIANNGDVGINERVVIANSDNYPIATVLGELNVPVTGGDLSFSLGRKYTNDNQLLTVAEVESVCRYEGSIDGETSNFRITGFDYQKLKELMQRMLNAGESIYNSYTITAKYTGNTDFLPKIQEAKIGKIHYPCLNPLWYVWCDDGTRWGLIFPDDGGNLTDYYKVSPGDVVNIEFNTNCDNSYDYLHDNLDAYNVPIPNLKTNITFFDYDHDITLGDGRVISAGQGLEIPTDSQTWFAGSHATNNGLTDSEGKCTWTWQLPSTATWNINRPNCKLRCTIQNKDDVNFEENNQSTVIDVPFKILND